jgi:hypothetical protein
MHLSEFWNAYARSETQLEPGLKSQLSMRIKTNRAKNQGSVLLVTLCSAWIIGIALVSYLTLVANQHRTTHHSQTWNNSIPVLESGIEEALTQLNYNNGEGVIGATAHGWTLMTNGYYFKSRVVDSMDGSYFDVTINPNTNAVPAAPIITSQGFVRAPGNTGVPMGGGGAFGMILGTVSQSTPAMVSRTVRVNTRLVNLGTAAVGGIRTKGTILFSGGGSLDSFDSSDPTYSTNGKYDPAKRKANGIALSNSAVADAVHVDNSHIYGSVVTGAGGAATINGGSVGDLAWNASNTGFQPGHKTSDANVQFDDVAVPFVYGTGSTPVAGSVGGTNYTYVVNGVANSKWNLGSVNISGGKSLVVTGGEASLYINGNFTTSGSGFVYIAPGASLKLYVSGTFTVSGTGVMNGTGLASKNSIYGLGTAKENWAYSGSSAFIGTVYSPYDQFTFSGGAGAFGSFTANNVIISGGASVHYDEHLDGSPSDPEYLISSWNEI